ncbi:MAG: hypothetical protein MNPFHGCM_03302 [Gemmatimonadaceae bacterium]|nr:hypothetical protein [Gemmatimonadaceae bacterium]
MSLVEQVKKETAELLTKRSEDASLRELAEFYREKQREGVVLSGTYDLPPIDTIGRTAFRSK